MMVDVETAKHVELLSSSIGGRKTKGSLFGVLNRCSTPGGTKMLRASLFQPPVQVRIYIIIWLSLLLLFVRIPFTAKPAVLGSNHVVVC
jgi:hypothetical protein